MTREIRGDIRTCSVRREDMVGGYDQLPVDDSVWEAEFRVRGGSVSITRKILEGTMLALNLAVETQRHLRYRYYCGYFDSVAKFFVLSQVKIPVFIALEEEVRSVPFRVSLCQQSEYVWDSPLRGAHRDMTLLNASGIDFTESGILMREKLDGVPFYKIREGDKSYFVGSSISFEIDKDFPVQMAEWVNGKMHVLHPFGLPKLMIGDMEFVPHQWLPLSRKELMTYKEGVMVLVKNVEYRIKHHPTVEVDMAEMNSPSPMFTGVWEVQNSGGELVPVRPRPGKPALNKRVAEGLLQHFARVRDLNLPEVSMVDVVYKTAGPIGQSFKVSGMTVTIDSGWRVKGEDLVAPIVLSEIKTSVIDQIYRVGDVFHHIVPTGTISSPRLLPDPVNMVVSSKVLLFDHKGSLFVRSDDGKLLDAVGGKIEPGEDSFRTLQREVREEIGVELTDAKFIGVSSQIEEECEFHTYVYLAPFDQVGKKRDEFVKFSNNSHKVEDFVPWFSRYMNLLYKNCPAPMTMRQYYSSLTKAKGPQVVEQIYSRTGFKGMCGLDVPKNWRAFSQYDKYIPPHKRRKKN